MIDKYFIFQKSSYGTGKIDSDLPADIYKYKQIPCTPSGDFIAKIETGEKAKELITLLNAGEITESDVQKMHQYTEIKIENPIIHKGKGFDCSICNTNSNNATDAKFLFLPKDIVICSNCYKEMAKYFLV